MRLVIFNVVHRQQAYPKITHKVQNSMRMGLVNRLYSSKGANGVGGSVPDMGPARKTRRVIAMRFMDVVT